MLTGVGYHLAVYNDPGRIENYAAVGSLAGLAYGLSFPPGEFASDDEFQSQGERGLMACPLCDDKPISRLPSAPRLNVTRHEQFTPRLE